MALLSASITPTNLVTTSGAATLTNKTFSDNPTFSGGTASGVAFLNGSKVLTSGSALTFDGTTATTPRLALGGTTLPSAGTATLFSRTSDNNTYLQTGSGNTFFVLDGSQNTMFSASPTALGFLISNAEVGRFTSTGLGIGTSSPSVKLEVVGAIKVTDDATVTGFGRLTLGFATGNSGARLDLLGWASGNKNFRISSAYFGSGLDFTPSTTAGGTTFTTPAFSMLSSGVFSVTSGVQFPATQSASADANTLDDYEEGTWTPTQGTFDTWTSPVFTATYTKIGRLVTVFLSQQSGTIGWSAADYMGGLPFTVGANLQAIGYAGDTTPVSDNGYILADGNSTLLFFNQANASENALCFTVSYQV